VIVTPQIRINNGGLRVVAHASRADDVPGALSLVTVVNLRGAEPSEDLLMSLPRRRQAGSDVIIQALGEARDRNAVHVPLSRVKRDPVVRIRQLLDEGGQPDVA
jgi:hypothetical protein